MGRHYSLPRHGIEIEILDPDRDHVKIIRRKFAGYTVGGAMSSATRWCDRRRLKWNRISHVEECSWEGQKQCIGRLRIERPKVHMPVVGGA